MRFVMLQRGGEVMMRKPEKLNRATMSPPRHIVLIATSPSDLAIPG